MMNHHRAADVATGISVPSWLISLATDTLPIIQWVAGFLAIVASGFAIYKYVRELRSKKA